MTGKAKQKALILLGLVAILTIMIAASLPRLELQPGMPLPRLEQNQVVAAPVQQQPFVSISVNKFIVILFALLLTGAMLYVGYKLLTGADWKLLASFIPPLLVISLVVLGFIFLILMLPRSDLSAPMDLRMPTPEPLDTSPLGPVPPLLTWLVGLGLLITSLLIGAWVFLSASKPAPTLEVVGLEAEKAWQALQTGLDLKVVIIQCYRQMSLALEKEQGLERQDFMTIREFQNLLETAGAPSAPIHQLTQLFEAVRYGNWQPNPADEQKALHCLEAIMVYSREAKRKGAR